MPQGMLEDLHWILGTTFLVWAGLGLAFGLRQGVRAGFILYAIVVAVSLVVLGLFGLFIVLAATPFGAASGLAGVWGGAKLRPAALKALRAIRRPT